MKLMLMGPPGSGKGTVGKLLSEKLGLPVFSVGKLLRDISESSIFFKPLHEDMDKGNLAPSGIPAGVIREELKKDQYSEGYILDGWMRNLEQRDYFDPGANFVIFINISNETVVKRISGRRYCPKDNFHCNIYTLPPKNPNSCDLCGGKLTQRNDDNEKVVEDRLDLYEEETLPVIKHYRKSGDLIEVDGEGTPKEVLDLILSELKKRDSN